MEPEDPAVQEVMIIGVGSGSLLNLVARMHHASVQVVDCATFGVSVEQLSQQQGGVA